MQADEPCCSTRGEAGPGDYVPQGALERIGDIEVYTNQPAEGGAAGKILLVLPDGFGLATHNKILADRFTKHGWTALIPDYFEGDPLPVELLNRDKSVPVGQLVDMPAWLKRHSPERVEDILQRLVNSLRAQAPDAMISAVGYCYGGKYALRLAGWALHSAALFHPSFVKAEDVKDIKAPTYIGLAKNDDMVPASLPEDLKSWIVAEQTVKIEMYPGVGHGFAARPNSTDTAVMVQYEAAFQATIQHFEKYFVVA